MKRVSINPDELIIGETILCAEGGSVSLAQTAEGQPCLLIDESATIGLLSAEDAQGMEATSVFVFDSDEARSRYVESRWGERANPWRWK